MIKGAFGVTGLLVTGFVEDEQEALWLELLADNESVAIARADLPRPHGLGFILPFPPSPNHCTRRESPRLPWSYRLRSYFCP